MHSDSRLLITCDVPIPYKPPHSGRTLGSCQSTDRKPARVWEWRVVCDVDDSLPDAPRTLICTIPASSPCKGRNLARPLGCRRRQNCCWLQSEKGGQLKARDQVRSNLLSLVILLVQRLVSTTNGTVEQGLVVAPTPQEVMTLIDQPSTVLPATTGLTCNQQGISKPLVST